MNRKLKNPLLLFFLGYAFLMVSLVFLAINYDPGKSGGLAEEPKAEVRSEFSSALEAHDETRKQKQKAQEDRRKPSNAFVITAISVASVLDVVIILIWARHENRKCQGATSPAQKRWTDQKWFWNVVAFGIVQPKDGKIRINWVNFFAFIVAMYILKTLLFNTLEDRSNAGPTFSGFIGLRAFGT